MAKSKGHDFTHQEFNEVWQKLESRYEKETEKKLRPNEYLHLVTHLRKFPDVNIHLSEPKENEGQSIYRAYLESQKPVSRAPIITIAVDFAQALKAYAEGIAVTPWDDYYRYLQDLYTKSGNLGEKNLSLQDIYIEPKINNSGDENLEGLNLPKTVHNWLEAKKNISNYYNNVLIILGDPGQGKTSLCYHLLFQLTKTNKRPIYYFPLRYIRSVSDFYTNPFGTIYNHLKTEGYYKKDESNGIIPIEIENFKQSILILDGLDELEKIHDLDKDELYFRISEETRKLFRPFKLIITSRKELDSNMLYKEDIPCWELSELTTKEQKLWIKKYNTKASQPSLLTNKEIDFLNNFKSPISPLMRQPILLHIIVQLEIQPNTSYNASKIYDELFERLINRYWDSLKKNNIHKELYKRIKTKQELRLVLQEFSIELFKRNSTYLSYNAIPIKIINKLRLNSDQKTDALKALLISFYFKFPENNKKSDNEFAIEFLHKTFGEYLAAEGIWQKIQEIFNKPNKSIIEIITDLRELFDGITYLTTEIEKYLLEIIINERDNKNQPSQSHYKLGEIMSSYIEELTKYNFHFNIEPKLGILDSILKTYYGFLSIYSRVSYNSSNTTTKLPSDLLRFLIDKKPDINLEYSTLTGVNLSQTNLGQVNLKNSNISFSDLRHTLIIGGNLNNSTLRYAKISDANLSKANLSHSHLDYADITDSILNETNLCNATLVKTDLKYSQLRYAKLNGANLNQADLSFTNLSYAIFKDANLSNSDLRYANLSNVNLVNANLRGAILYGVKGLNYSILSQVKSLYESKYLPSEIEFELKKNLPHLFLITDS